MVPDLALRKTVNQAVGIWAAFRHLLTVPKTSTKGDSEQECHMNHPPLSDCLTKNKLELEFFFSPQDSYFFKFPFFFYYEPECFLEIPQRISQWLHVWSPSVTHHIYLPAICCLSPLSFVYLPVSSMSLPEAECGLGDHCYHCAVIRCVSSVHSERIWLRLLEGLNGDCTTWLFIFQILL